MIAHSKAHALVRRIARLFDLPGDLVDAHVLPGGHIHDSYVGAYRRDGRCVRYLHQRLNSGVFADPARLMENVARVTAHLHARLARDGARDPERRALTLIATRDGRPACVDANGAFWRTYLYIEDSRSYETAPCARLAEGAAAAFGRFAQMLADLPAPALHPTIPGFHDTPARLQQLRAALARDPLGRADEAQAEIEFALGQEALVSVLAQAQARGELPARVAHNDSKIANVLFDARTFEALCVVDLDTVMPGLLLHDFGDLVRSSVSPVSEDERDLGRSSVRLDIFEALVRGYLRTAGTLLNAHEIRLLPLAGPVITLETGIRFLTDYLQGDVYFRTAHPQHNLERARNQFELVRRMQRCEAQMTAVVARVSRQVLRSG